MTQDMMFKQEKANERFLQLMELADEGDESARADLFKEFGVAREAGGKEASRDR